jgi:hypothetical protein
LGGTCKGLCVLYLFLVNRTSQPGQVDRGHQEGSVRVAEAAGGLQQSAEAGRQSEAGAVRAEHPLGDVLKQLVPQFLLAPGS